MRTRPFDADAIAAEAGAGGNPVVAARQALRERSTTSARRHVHFGATSQDILDTATVLVARGALG